jgi:hypothetical protein
MQTGWNTETIVTFMVQQKSTGQKHGYGTEYVDNI